MLRRLAFSLMLATLVAGCSTVSPSNGVQDVAEGSGYYSLALPSLPASAPANAWAAARWQDATPHQASPAMIREVLLAEHQRWVGTPYVLGGDSRRGIDCSALVQRVYREAFRFDLPRTTEEQRYTGKRIERHDLQSGDLVFFRSPGRYHHVGIYVGQGFFLHASTSRGVKLSRLDNVYWRQHYWQARRPMEPTELAQRAIRANNG
ncbi:C40 family peptidase [Halomonas sp. WWR20]